MNTMAPLRPTVQLPRRISLTGLDGTKEYSFKVKAINHTVLMRDSANNLIDNELKPGGVVGPRKRSR